MGGGKRYSDWGKGSNDHPNRVFCWEEQPGSAQHSSDRRIPSEQGLGVRGGDQNKQLNWKGGNAAKRGGGVFM